MAVSPPCSHGVGKGRARKPGGPDNKAVYWGVTKRFDFVPASGPSGGGVKRLLVCTIVPFRVTAS